MESFPGKIDGISAAHDQVCGIIGYGNIGRRVAEIMKYGYKNKIIAYDPFLPKSVADEQGIRLVSLTELFEKSDFIFIHCNLTEENKGMINEEVLKHAKPSAVLINCARGGLVDEDAIAAAVEQGGCLDMVRIQRRRNRWRWTTRC